VVATSGGISCHRQRPRSRRARGRGSESWQPQGPGTTPAEGAREKVELVLFSNHLLVCGQGDEREVVAIEVVHQVKDAGETGAGVVGLVPGTIGALGLQAMPLATDSLRVSLAASKPITAQAVCEGVLGPTPFELGLS